MASMHTSEIHITDGVLDALVVNVDRSIYLAIVGNQQGYKEVLGLRNSLEYVLWKERCRGAINWTLSNSLKCQITNVKLKISRSPALPLPRSPTLPFPRSPAL